MVGIEPWTKLMFTTSLEQGDDFGCVRPLARPGTCLLQPQATPLREYFITNQSMNNSTGGIKQLKANDLGCY